MTLFDESEVILDESDHLQVRLVETDQNLIVETRSRQDEQYEWVKENYIVIPLSGKQAILQHLTTSAYHE